MVCLDWTSPRPFNSVACPTSEHRSPQVVSAFEILFEIPPVPRFRSSRYIAAGTATNFGNIKGIGKHFMPVPLSDLKFLLRTRSGQCRNFKSAALAGTRQNPE